MFGRAINGYISPLTSPPPPPRRGRKALLVAVTSWYVLVNRLDLAKNLSCACKHFPVTAAAERRRLLAFVRGRAVAGACLGVALFAATLRDNLVRGDGVTGGELFRRLVFQCYQSRRNANNQPSNGCTGRSRRRRMVTAWHQADQRRRQAVVA